MPLGPAQQYVVTFNGQQLPGYAQSETDPSELGITDHYAFDWDGAISQQTGLQNKNLVMQFLIWEPTYRECKNQYHKAAAILRSRRHGWSKLFVDYTDRYFNAIVKSVSYPQDVSQPRRILKYDVDFECQPWQIGTTTHTLTGTGTVTTDSVSRDFTSGGWSPTTITVTGTNITVSGYSDSDPFTGFISISGAVAGMVIDTENYTATIGGLNANDRMYWKDYGMFVGAGKTTFVNTGASSFSLSYNDRWY